MKEDDYPLEEQANQFVFIEAVRMSERTSRVDVAHGPVRLNDKMLKTAIWEGTVASYEGL